MADNTVLNTGAGGDTIATDDCAGVKYQQVKLVDGTLDSTTAVASGNGTAANSLRVTVASDSTGTVAATQSGTWNITNVSGTVSLPTGAATAAKQPALGTAGTASSDVITVQGIASMTALKVDGSAVTQPVSAASLPLPTGASTAAKQPALGPAGTASADVITVQGIASMTALKVDGSAVTQPVSGTVSITANSAVNVAQLAGTTTDTNSGVKSAGTLRVVLATDQPQLTNKLLVTPDANSAVNVAQMNGVAVTMGNGVAGTGVQRVAIASDNTAFTVNAAQSGTWTVQPGNTANTTAWLVQDVSGTTGGMSFSALVGAASNNKTQIKATAGTLYLVSVQNLASTPVYLKVFNKTSANVTAGTTACDFQFMIPGNTAGAGVVLDSAKGIAMGTAITIMLTAGIATTDNTSVVANNQVVLIGYK